MRASEQAAAIVTAVERSGEKLVLKIRGKKYLRFEGWQTIARFNRATPVTEWTTLIEEDGVPIAYEARVVLKSLDTMEVIAAAEAMCGFTDKAARGQKDIIGKRNAARSMAQTRAAGKAMRMAFSYVIALAGFQGSTAEEMEDFEEDDEGRRKSSIIVS